MARINRHNHDNADREQHMHAFNIGKEQEWDPKKHVEKILAELEAMAANSYSAAGAMALVNSLLGNMDETVRWAERAVTQRDPQVLGIKTTPAYANLRSDPRYPALLAKMNLTA